ncbi:tetratricopeptide repeat-containing sensor histidine kinase [Tenacibaculum jejuense]|uniref:tetratricopeptide repeat-containing sensor histidine kinase n=1 Tax=Tenacibaculum jejuense TaxID=584609 RepID=UPI00138FC1FD|nr:tetratricopeptide repeat-containing sensor histidine kinase [Tenacibaculum jejuense]
MKVKAESAHSAFAVFEKESDTTLVQRFELAKILYEEDRYTRALKMVLPLTNRKEVEIDILIKANLLAGQILSKDTSNTNAIAYLKKSLNLLENYKFSTELKGEASDYLVAQNYDAISKFYLHKGKKDSSEYYFEKIIKLPGLDERIMGLKAKAYTNLGKMYAFNKDFKKAEEYTLESIKINTQFNNNLSLALAYNNLGNLYLERGSYKEGREIYGKALTYLKNEKSLRALQHKELLLDNIAWALYNLKDYRAYEYVTDSYAIRDSLNIEETRKAYKKIESKYNVKEFQKEADKKQQKQEQKTWAVGTAGVIISILLLYLANLYKLRQRNLSLKLSQNELRQQRKLERLNSQAQVKILNATLDGKETERKQIAEILHDNVSALLSSANMHLQATQKQYGDDIPEELEKTQQIITEASEKIRDLSHNLVSSILLKFGLEYATKDVAKKFSNSEIKISTAILNVYRYSQEFEIKVFNIIQELINNILKHSKAKNAYIMLEEEDDMINLIVKDDGVGFEMRSDKDSGIGLNQIRARINMMNGNFIIESSKGNGTKVIASIPVIQKKEMVSA